MVTPEPATAGLLLGPTPMQPADRLGAAIGLGPGQLWVKRDDLTPLAGGGNKVRKLDHLCAAALAAGSDVLVTGGGPQSNHVRLTAAAARRLGLEAVVVLAGEPPAEGPTGNLVVDALLGAEIEWTGRADLVALERAIEAAGVRVAAAGRRPYVIAVGGADPIGCQGYVHAAAEIRRQLPEVSLVVTPAGTGGTQAGLAAGFGSHDPVLGVSVGAFTDIEARVRTLAGLAAELAGLPAPTGPVRLDLRYAEAGYGTRLDETLDAMRMAARTEGLILDPVYNGKALAGLAAGLRDGTVAVAGPVVLLVCGGSFGLLSAGYSAWAAGPSPW